MNTATDSTMDLFTPRHASREEDDAQTLSDHLYLAGGWCFRRELMAALEWSDDRVRHAGEAAKGKVIFGQRGMKHIRHATKEEFLHCVKIMKSQAAAQHQRVINTENEWYRWGGKI
jgi:hypothetical protein